MRQNYCLRNGEQVGEYGINDLPRVQLISKMMGKDLDDIHCCRIDSN